MRSAFRFMPEQASTVSPSVDALYLFLVGVSACFTLLILACLLYFAIKYRRRSALDKPDPVPTSLALEIGWILVPLGIAMVMFFWGAKIYVRLATPPAESMEIYAIGKQWMWKFQHPDGQREINELHVPVGRPVRLTMTSQDVIHSFYVPAFRVKADVLPGRYTTVWFEATQPGTYHLFCAEYCGTQHSGMIGHVVVLAPDRYAAWLSGATERARAEAPLPGGAPEGGLAAQGQKLFQDLGCDTCHRLDRQGTCPVLVGLYGQSVQLQGGETVVADDNYLRESILNPTAKLVLGFQPLMPSYQGRLSEEQIVALIAYIKSLGSQQILAPARSSLTGEPTAQPPR